MRATSQRHQPLPYRLVPLVVLCHYFQCPTSPTIPQKLMAHRLHTVHRAGTWVQRQRAQSLLTNFPSKSPHPSEAVVFNDLAIATWLDKGLFLGTDSVTEAAWTTFVQLLSQK